MVTFYICQRHNYNWVAWIKSMLVWLAGFKFHSGQLSSETFPPKDSIKTHFSSIWVILIYLAHNLTQVIISFTRSINGMAFAVGLNTGVTNTLKVTQEDEGRSSRIRCLLVFVFIAMICGLVSWWHRTKFHFTHINSMVAIHWVHVEKANYLHDHVHLLGLPDVKDGGDVKDK